MVIQNGGLVFGGKLYFPVWGRREYHRLNSNETERLKVQTRVIMFGVENSRQRKISPEELKGLGFQSVHFIYTFQR